jgi:NAD(P)-dependent dehydrogenase (short-subunit alcohol dehydrogenase family)
MEVKEVRQPKYALVTGAAGNIGHYLVKELMREGWHVIGLDLKPHIATQSFVIDLLDIVEVKRKAENIISEIGSIQLLITAHKPFIEAQVGDLSLERWKELLKVNLGGTTNICHAIAPAMIDYNKGTIICLTRYYELSQKGFAYQAVAGEAIHGFAKSFACEVAPHNVTVNCVVLGEKTQSETITNLVLFLEENRFFTGQVFTMH